MLIILFFILDGMSCGLKEVMEAIDLSPDICTCIRNFSRASWTSQISFMVQEQHSDSFKETVWLREVDKMRSWLISAVSRSLLMAGKKEFCQQIAFRLKLHTSCWFYFLKILTDVDFPQRILMLKLWQSEYEVRGVPCFLMVLVKHASVNVTCKTCIWSNR